MANADFTFEMSQRDYQALQKILTGVSNVDKQKAILGSLLQGAKEIGRAGKSNLSTRNKKKTGNLSKSIASKIVRKWSAAYAGFKRSGAYKGNHSHLVDRGTAKRWTKKGAYRGSVSKGSPYTGTKFWTDAVKTNGPMAMSRVMDVIYDELDKITRRKK